MTTEIEINFKDRPKALRFKRHLEKTHPSTRGNIKIQGMCKPKKQNKFKFNPMQQAEMVTQLLK